MFNGIWRYYQSQNPLNTLIIRLTDDSNRCDTMQITANKMTSYLMSCDVIMELREEDALSLCCANSDGNLLEHRPMGYAARLQAAQRNYLCSSNANMTYAAGVKSAFANSAMNAAESLNAFSHSVP